VTIQDVSIKLTKTFFSAVFNEADITCNYWLKIAITPYDLYVYLSINALVMEHREPKSSKYMR